MYLCVCVYCIYVRKIKCNHSQGRYHRSRKFNIILLCINCMAIKQRQQYNNIYYYILTTNRACYDVYYILYCYTLAHSARTKIEIRRRLFILEYYKHLRIHPFGYEPSTTLLLNSFKVINIPLVYTTCNYIFIDNKKM